MPEIFVFGGCNGSGKSTLAISFLSSLSNVEFVNADLIAAQLNPQDVDSVAIPASRLMLERLNYLSGQRIDFAFETTLAARSFARFLKQSQTNGYRINLFYIWLNSPELAIYRVSRRVASGGHNIPEDVIRRRYQRGLLNFFELYSTLADCWIVYDNSKQRQKIAEKPFAQSQIIYKPTIWQQINSSINP
jgi:predicted ABC-type ATPase